MDKRTALAIQVHKGAVKLIKRGWRSDKATEVSIKIMKEFFADYNRKTNQETTDDD